MSDLNGEMISALGRLAERWPGCDLQIENWNPTTRRLNGYPPVFVDIAVESSAEDRRWDFHHALIKRDGSLYIARGDWLKDPAFRQFEREAIHEADSKVAIR